ncbi:putative effector protein [Ceratobasidium theobromae]|uniref:Putative effector protein n=1 Tax=Ceratobasidium theobromae TaxID=1582974 RepID=A0A5N5QIT1_9AGAM|nr:putative effector protein [Ceratobasidium theobromae]
MMFGLPSLIAVISFIITLASALPMAHRRQSACFLVGNKALPAEVSSVVSSIAAQVTCGSKTIVNTGGVPDVISGGISYSDIDFQSSSKSPIGFALDTFITPTDPATADLETLQNQLNTYLAMEAGVRSTGSNILGRLKGAKFFLQFQIARVHTAQGAQLGVADTVEHQLGKVLKNAVGATQAEKDVVTALSRQV